MSEQEVLQREARDALESKEKLLQNACNDIIEILKANYEESFEFKFKSMVEGILINVRNERTQEACVNNFLSSLEEVLVKPRNPIYYSVEPLASPQNFATIENILAMSKEKPTPSSQSISSFKLKMLLAVMGGVLIGASLIALGMFSIITGTGPLVGLALLTCVPVSILAKATIIIGAIVIAAPPISFAIYGFFSMPMPNKSTSKNYFLSTLPDAPDLVGDEPKGEREEDTIIINVENSSFTL